MSVVRLICLRTEVGDLYLNTAEDVRRMSMIGE